MADAPISAPVARIAALVENVRDVEPARAPLPMMAARVVNVRLVAPCRAVRPAIVAVGEKVRLLEPCKAPLARMVAEGVKVIDVEPLMDAAPPSDNVPSVVKLSDALPDNAPIAVSVAVAVNVRATAPWIATVASPAGSVENGRAESGLKPSMTYHPSIMINP